MGWVHYGLSAFIVLGITDDDLRETAYEILLACAGASGYVSHLVRVVCILNSK